MEIPRLTLNDGHTLPALGFGTVSLRDEDGIGAMVHALEAGYRLLDTAVNYRNEVEVGEAVRRSGLAREEVQIATKVPGRHHAYDLCVTSVEDSLRRLRTDYVDLVHIHWPNPGVGRYVEAWRALVALRDRGLIRSVCVSNFTAAHLAAVIDDSGVTPAVNQIEMHPLFPQEEMRATHRDLGIVTEAWSPLAKRDAPYDASAVAAAAEAHGVTPAQVILRWHHQLGSVPIPKSSRPDRQRTNLDLFSFELTSDEVAAITALGREDGRLFDGDPDRHEEM